LLSAVASDRSFEPCCKKERGRTEREQWASQSAYGGYQEDLVMVQLWSARGASVQVYGVLPAKRPF
jgi:hypothetical protein